ncbi:hypothetical protein [Mangrovibrevibacter kandeliae]|uniref:hypothetical protein n=1 Tax=Mangrovibrevibacter kandeliae TaxID=2968473 RepID=UPI00211833A8|nr:MULTISPECIES: hypothetical protein [unclassified Aurantimonas]MCW4115285.1 hypothetical protein [Aurantimonas sp. MSK8Z-1]
MTMNRLGLRAACAVALGMALSGCIGPTYGTGKTSGEQLFDDMDSMLLLGNSNKASIDYSPRPELVKPADKNVLPQPEETRSASNGANWPESPEARRARLQAAAYSGDEDSPIPAAVMTADKEGYDPADRTPARANIAMRNDNADTELKPGELRSKSELVKQRLAENRQGSPTQRKYLSEPPLDYRQPSDSAPIGDPGEDEDVKAARLKAGGKKTVGETLKGLWPF